MARADVNLVRDNLPLSSAPDSVALGDLDGVHGKDIVVALWQPGAVGVMLNNGDGTFGALTPYSAGPDCAGLAVDITLGDVTGPAGPFVPDGKLDAYVACTPYVVRLTGNGAGALGAPSAFNLNLPPYLGSATLELLALIRRPNGNPAPLLAFAHGVGSFGRELCVTYDPLDGEDLACNHTTASGPLAVGDLNGVSLDVPPDEIVASEFGDKLGVFGFSPPPLFLSESSRTVTGGIESAAIGDLDDDGDNDVLVGQFVNSLSARVASVHSFVWGATGLEQIARPLPSIGGLDAVAIADVDGDGCNDVVGAGAYGRGIVHLADGSGGFDGGQDLAQIGYQNPATSTRVTMAVGDLTGDGLPELVISDYSANAVMVYANHSTPSGGGCFDSPPVARDDAAVVSEDAAATAIDVLANDSDPEGDPMTIASVTQPAHGTAAIAGTDVTYRPDADYCNDLGGTPDTFTYTLNGGSTATVSVTVQCVHHDTPPTAHDDAAVISESAAATSIGVLANDSDPEGDPMSIASVTQPAHGTAAIAGTGVTYRPAADYCNDLGGMPDTFTYTLNGGSTATVSVTVQCVDDAPPVINPPAAATPTPAPEIPPTATPAPTPGVPRTCDNPGTVAFTVGTPGDDVLLGTAGRDVLSGRGGDDCVYGRGGDDRLAGGSGADILNGSSGDDRLNGDAGDDRINGGNGNDDITPGAGKDKVAAQGGDDTISARDGARDTIDCGAGRDKVTADRTDSVKSNCEFVKRAVRKG